MLRHGFQNDQVFCRLCNINSNINLNFRAFFGYDITKNQFPSSKKIHLVLSGCSLVLLCSGGDPRGVSTSAARAACDQRGRRAGRHALGAAAPRGALGDVDDLVDVVDVAGDGRAGGGAGRGGA